MPAVAVSVASCDAVTLIEPPASSVVSRIQACASDGVCAPPKALDETSGSPISASTALNRMLDDFHPIELNATTAPNVWSKPSIFDVAVASSVEVFSASTTMSPPAVDRRRLDPRLRARQHDVGDDDRAEARPRLHEAVVERDQRRRLERRRRSTLPPGGDGRVGDRRADLAAQVVVVDQPEVAVRAARQPVLASARVPSVDSAA